MLLSVIIPAYNVENYIENCLESLLSQDIDKEDYEIIIIDDGSIDNTTKICLDYNIKYSNIKYFRTENKGQAHARNYGIEKAHGDFIEFVDSDDYIAHNIFGTLKDSIKNNAELIYFESKRVTRNDCYLPENSMLSIVEYCSGEDLFANQNINNGPWSYWVKRSVLNEKNIRFVEGRYCEDGMFTCLLMSAIENSIYTNLDVYRYVVRDNSTVNKYEKSHQKKMIDDFLYATCYLDDLYKKNKLLSNNYRYQYALNNRMASYLFFLQARMLKYGDYKYGKEIIKELMKKGIYPYKWNPYKGKCSILYKFFRHKRIYLMLLKAAGVFQNNHYRG